MSTEVMTDQALPRAADLIALTKPRITLMVVLTTSIGFLLASSSPFPYIVFLHTLLGTALVAGGAAVLNQVVERHTDALMRRTADRPIPAGRVTAEQGLAFAVVIASLGMLYLAFCVNLLTALLAAFTLGSYVFVYTPLKRHSSLATVVGAVPGAVPPMMGCAAATGTLDALAWVLFGILFLWQMPHFLAIAWLYKSDYARGGFPLLTVDDATGARTTRQMVLYAAALVPVSLLPTVLGVSGWAYLVGALLLGLLFLGASVAFGLRVDSRAARRLVLVSVFYLPVVLLLLLVDHAAF